MCLGVAHVGLQEKILSWVSLESLNAAKLLARTFVLTLSSFASLTKLPFRNVYTKHKANPLKGYKLDVSVLKIHALSPLLVFLRFKPLSVVFNELRGRIKGDRKGVEVQ